jgi:hypothetical protein
MLYDENEKISDLSKLNKIIFVYKGAHVLYTPNIKNIVVFST